MALCDNAVARLGDVVSTDDASTLLFLPLAHIFARFIQVLSLTAGARVGHSSDVKNLLDDLADFRPTFLLSVPRVFEKIYNSSEQKAETEGKGKQRYRWYVACEEWKPDLDVSVRYHQPVVGRRTVNKKALDIYVP